MPCHVKLKQSFKNFWAYSIFATVIPYNTMYERRINLILPKSLQNLEILFYDTPCYISLFFLAKLI